MSCGLTSLLEPALKQPSTLRVKTHLNGLKEE